MPREHEAQYLPLEFCPTDAPLSPQLVVEKLQELLRIEWFSPACRCQVSVAGKAVIIPLSLNA